MRCAKLLPVAMLYQSIGCLPNDAFARVLAENIVLTASIFIQTVTSVIFNTFFGII